MENGVPKWALGLAEEDWRFVKRLLLASGSLKDVANQYNISYPTVRLRLNRLIEKVRVLDSDGVTSKFHQKVRVLVAEGKLEMTVAKELLREYQDEINSKEK